MIYKVPSNPNHSTILELGATWVAGKQLGTNGQVWERLCAATKII